MNWLQRLGAFPAAYRRNVLEALKISAAIGGGSQWTVYYYAFRITLLTLRRRRRMAADPNPNETRKTLDLARLKVVAAEIDRPGTVGLILVPDAQVMTTTRDYLFPLVRSHMRVYSNTGRRAEFTNGSSVLFRQDASPEVARGYRLNWVWLVAPKDTDHVDMWRGSLRNMLGYSTGRLYVASTETFSPTPSGGLSLDRG